MIIEQIDSRRVLISLKEEDLKTYAITIDKLNIKDEACKDAMKKLLYSVCGKLGICLKDKAVLIEAMPHKEGVLILATVDAMKKLRKTYRVKKQKALPCCRFNTAEELMGCIEHLGRIKAKLPPNSLWEYGGEYYLFFSIAGISSRAKVVLSEYAACMSMGIGRAARIKEAGKVLLHANAAERIAEALGKAAKSER